MADQLHSKKKKNRPGQTGAGKSKGGQAKAGQNKTRVSLARLASFKALKLVFDGKSLSAAQAKTIDSLDDGRDRGLANELVNGVLRWRWQLEFFVSILLSKPLKQKDSDVQIILLMALYELLECRTPDYAIINEAVELVRKSGKRWADGLVNAVLRRFTREKETLISSVSEDSVKYSHPDWLLKKIRNDWPDHWQQILEANNKRPDFWLRVNKRYSNTEKYQQMLKEHDIESSQSGIADQALLLSQGQDVRQLPDFSQGAVSVQDVGAQLTAGLLNLDKGQRLLDLCAAPGGKTCHILEMGSSIKSLVAVESDELRMQRVEENVQRLKLDTDMAPELIVADAREFKQWWDGISFDRILIDAPCSASGVIRRHPDIKTHRRPTDIEPLVELQSEILQSAWTMLSTGGEMLYVTCSIFKDENQNQVQKFLMKNKNALELPINADWGHPCDFGRQLLPGEHKADGFYFCLIQKTG